MIAFHGLSIISAPAERQHCFGVSHATLDHANTLWLAQTITESVAGCVTEVIARRRHSLPCAVPSASRIPSRSRLSKHGTSHAWPAAASSNSLTALVIVTTTLSHGLTCQSRTGVKQGCPLSPNLFGFYTDGLHRYCALMALLMYLAFFMAQQSLVWGMLMASLSWPQVHRACSGCLL